MSVCQCVNCEFGRKLLKRSLKRGMIEEGDIYPHQFATHPKISLRYCKVLDLDFMKINSQIHYLLGNIGEFLGCFFPDILPPFPKKFPKSFIMNTAESSMPGRHWVAVVLLEGQCLYFDSFGVGVVESKLRKYLFSRYENVFHSRVCIQDVRSIKCGAFCVDFILNVKNHADYMNFMNMFSSIKLQQNDDILKERFKDRVFLVKGVK